METGDTSYLYKSMDIALDFIRDAGAGTPTGRELEPAQRILELCPAFFYFAESSMFNGEAAVAMLKYMWEEGNFLYEAPVYYNYNNRGLWHTTAFFTLASYFPEFRDVEIWQPVVDQRLDDIVHTLIGEDGCYNEATFGYPTSILAFLQKLIKACEDAGKEPPTFLREKLGLLSRYLMGCSYPSGVTAEWGEGGRAYTRTVLKQPAQLLNDKELLYWATNGEEGSVPQNTVFRFDKLKIVTSRTDWSDSGYMIFMNAKNGGYHNHKDSLSLNLYAKDREILSDTGMTTYDSKHPHFDWQRHQTKSHNTIEIDNTGQRGDTSTLTENGDSAIEVYSSDSSDRIMAWTDATAGFRHFRNVTFLKKLKFVIVSDMVHPQDQEQHTYTQNWHTRLQSRVSIDDAKVGSTNFTGGSNLQIIQSEPENLTASLETGYDSEGQSTTQYFSYKKVQTGDTAFNTVLFPIEEGETSEAVVKTLDTGVSSAVASAMEISVFKQGEDRQAVVYYNSHEYDENGIPVPERRSFGQYTSDGANATIILDADNEVQGMTLCFGTELAKENHVLLKSEQVLSSLSVEFEGDTAIVQSADESADAAKITFAAPDMIRRVTINGEEKPIVRQDGKIVVNGTDPLAPIPTLAPTGGLRPGGNASGGVQNFSSGGSVSAAAPTATNAPGSSQKPAEETSVFSDIRNHWAEKEIVAMANAGVVNGRENGIFEPEGEITRAEFASMAVRATGEKAKPYQGEFEDVRSSDWFAAQVQTAWEQGWITGENGIFRPNDGISRQEAAAVLCRMLGEKQPEVAPHVFLDYNRFESWAVPYIAQAAALGLMRGMEDGCFGPNEVVTRAQAAVLFYRLRQEWETLQETGIDSPDPAEMHKSNSDEESEKEKSL